MRDRRNSLYWPVFVGLVLLTGGVQARDLIFTAPPREKPEIGVAQYGPLAEYLTRLLKREVKYVHPNDWFSYQRDMRANRYDIVFDGPHFASWRIVKLGHEAMVRLPGELRFILFTRKDDNAIKTTDDLVGKRICGLAPPNLATLSIITSYSNPVRQPVVKAVKGGMPAVYKAFMKGECKAAVVRDTFYNKKLTDAQRAQLRIVFEPRPLPNQSITASTRLTAQEKDLIRKSLTQDEGAKYSQVIVKRFAGKNAKRFMVANSQEFTGISSMLEGVIFGW